MMARTSFIQIPSQSEKKPALDEEPVLRFVIERTSEAGTRREIRHADVGGLAANKEDALLVGRRERQRPGAAPGPVKQAWSRAPGASRLRNIFGTPSQTERLRHGIFEEQCSAIGRTTSRNAECRLSMDARILKVGLNNPRPRRVGEDEVINLTIVLKQGRCRGRMSGVAYIARSDERDTIFLVEIVAERCRNPVETLGIEAIVQRDGHRHRP